MLYRLVRPMRRSGSSHLQFVQRIPSDLAGRTGGLKLSIPMGGGEFHHVTLSERAKDVRFSLKTSDPDLVKTRQAAIAAYLSGVWQNLRATTPTILSRLQATALAGELYEAWASEAKTRRITSVVHTGAGWEPDDSGLTTIEEQTAFVREAERLRSMVEDCEPTELEPVLGPLVDRLLLRRGIAGVDTQSRALLLIAFAQALADAFELRSRHASGDYSPDPKAKRFPAWEEQKKTADVISFGAGPKVSLLSLVEDWWREGQAAGRKPSTYESYRNSMAAFVAFLKHDDASRVTPGDVVRFKDHRLASKAKRTGKPISAKTVKDSDLAALKTLFGWAVANRKMRENPATGVTIKIGKTRKLRSKGLTDLEAVSILAAALSYVPSAKEDARTAAAKRWVPWLCAYTGARVGELAQARKQDLRKEGGSWVLNITPECVPACKIDVVEGPCPSSRKLRWWS